MSDHAEHAHEAAAADASPEHEPIPTSFELTGHDGVDDVLGSLDGLESRPVGEHVAVFEAAHEALRAALAEAGDRSGSGTTR